MNKKLMIFLVVSVLTLAVVNAGIMAYFGQVKSTVDVEQPISFFVNEADHTGEQVSETVPCEAGETCMGSNAYKVVNDGESDRTLSLITSGNTNGVDVSYYELVDYEFVETVDIEGSDYDLEVTVAEDGDWMVWTFDFPVEEFTGDGNLNLALIIAIDGEGNGPAFQIHNNDGTDANYPWGTWLVSPWGPTIEDGWMGWHSSNTNTPVADFTWVEATGNRNVPHNLGIMEIRIKKSEILGDSFHWAANPTVGSGFWDADDVDMEIPDVSTGFDWSNPLVSTNYVYAELMEELISPITIPADSFIEFYPQFSVDSMATEGDYVIYTTVNPAE